MTNTNMQDFKFEEEIDQFIMHLDSQAEVMPLVMSLLSTRLIQESKCLDKFITKHDLANNLKESELDEDNEVDDENSIFIPQNLLKNFVDLTQKIETSELAYNLMPANFIVSFVSQYDAYLGRLIQTVFHVKPELLNKSEKNLLFSDLLAFNSIDDAKQYIIEKEVESVLRDNHSKQFKWLESNLKMTLTKDLPSFKDFIEITERRNLFVHCNGVISRQYIDVCNQNGVKELENLKLGDKLQVPPAYFSKCYSVLFEIGVKLGHVLWRKLLPEQLEDADNHLNNVCFELLKKGHNKLALNLLTFATDTLKKHFNQEILLIFTINKALAYYLSDKKEKSKEILSKTDWSATGQNFKLAVAILTEENEKALEIMRVIGSNEDVISKESYLDWPLFKEIRETKEFKKLFNEIFKEEMVFVESKPKGLEEILLEHQSLKKEIEEEKKAANNV